MAPTRFSENMNDVPLEPMRPVRVVLHVQAPPPRKPWGYSKPISQPALNGHVAKCGAQALQLSDEELAANGEFTHEINAALNITDAGER